MTTTDIHALVGAYALDAVDDVERADFERHVRDCDSCRTELDELRETAARLADSTWSVPPPRLRENVMAAVARTRQLPPTPAVRVRPVRPGRRRWLVAAAAAVVLAGGASATVYQIQDQRVRDAGSIAARAQRESDRTRDILAAPDLVVRTAPVAGGGKVTVAQSPALKAGVIMLGANAAPSDGRVYQLWTIRGQRPTSAGALRVGQTSTVQIVDGLPGADLVGVTAEPAGGSVTPTMPLVSQVPLV
ncbi:anti-sigma factor domain-containing protein [Actinoplanes sp. NPDC049265]|uniref:anti-sigma factor n=1 Tax=Actinoplanes sp. NPDC049265 TaxID=3363902 RepID=UPI00371C6637